jgi:hypothetical protein
MTIELANPDKSNYKDVIPTHSKDVMEYVNVLIKIKYSFLGKEMLRMS